MTFTSALKTNQARVLLPTKATQAELIKCVENVECWSLVSPTVMKFQLLSQNVTQVQCKLEGSQDFTQVLFRQSNILHGTTMNFSPNVLHNALFKILIFPYQVGTNIDFLYQVGTNID